MLHTAIFIHSTLVQRCPYPHLARHGHFPARIASTTFLSVACSSHSSTDQRHLVSGSPGLSLQFLLLCCQQEPDRHAALLLTSGRKRRAGARARDRQCLLIAQRHAWLLPLNLVSSGIARVNTNHLNPDSTVDGRSRFRPRHYALLRVLRALATSSWTESSTAVLKTRRGDGKKAQDSVTG